MGGLSSFIKKFISSKFARNVTLVASGTILGQLIMIAASPILSRIYSPADFGSFAVFSSTVGIMAIIASMRYEIAIPLGASDGHALNLAKLAAFFSLLVSSIMLFSAGLWAVPFMQAIGLAPSYKSIVYLIPIGIIMTSIYQIANFIVIRKGKHGVLASSRIVQGATAASTQLVLGVLSFGPLGLALGLLAGRFSAAAYSLSRARIEKERSISLREVAVKYSRFPKLALPSGGINAFAVEMPMLLTSAIFGTGAAGLYSLAQRVVVAPMSMLGKSIAQVYMSSLGEYVRDEDPRAARLFFGVSKRLLFIALPPFFLLGVVAPWLFGVIFGDSWLETGHLVRILTPAFLAQFVAVPLSQTLNFIGKQDYQLAWDVFRFLGVLTVFTVARHWQLGYLQTFLAYSLFLTVAYLVLYLVMAMSLRRIVQAWHKGSSR